MLSHVLADMIGDNRNMPSDYSLREHSAYIRIKFTRLIKSYHLVCGELLVSQIKYFPLELWTYFLVLSSILKYFLVPDRQVPFLLREGLGPQGPYSNYAYGPEPLTVTSEKSGFWRNCYTGCPKIRTMENINHFMSHLSKVDHLASKALDLTGLQLISISSHWSRFHLWFGWLNHQIIKLN